MRPTSTTRLKPLNSLNEDLKRDNDTDSVYIADEMTFKNTMTSDYKKITSLSLVSEKITLINYGNSVLLKLSHLIKLDLSFNKIAIIQNLEPLKSL